MNLHGLIKGAVGRVNPFISGSVRFSVGYTTNLDGTRSPLYSRVNDVSMQVQPLSTTELRLVDALNLQGTMRAFYLFGEAAGLIRQEKKGGDLLSISGGVNQGTWLVSTVLEQWPDWVKVVGTLQNGDDPAAIPMMDFSRATNSSYAAILEQQFWAMPMPYMSNRGGGLNVLPSYDFSNPNNSFYAPSLAS